MSYWTITPGTADQMDPRVVPEILRAAERLNWPDVIVQPERRPAEWEASGSNVAVTGEGGWRVFVQLMTGRQAQAARRLLLALLVGDGAEGVAEEAIQQLTPPHRSAAAFAKDAPDPPRRVDVRAHQDPEPRYLLVPSGEQPAVTLEPHRCAMCADGPPCTPAPETVRSEPC